MVGLIVQQEQLEPIIMDDSTTKLHKKKRRKRMDSDAVSPQLRSEKKVGSPNCLIVKLSAEKESLRTEKKKKKKAMKKKMGKEKEGDHHESGVSSSKVWPTGPDFEDSSSENEKKSLLAWVEMSMGKESRNVKKQVLEDHVRSKHRFEQVADKANRQISVGDLTIERSMAAAEVRPSQGNGSSHEDTGFINDRACCIGKAVTLLNGHLTTLPNPVNAAAGNNPEQKTRKKGSQKVIPGFGPDKAATLSNGYLTTVLNPMEVACCTDLLNSMEGLNAINPVNKKRKREDEKVLQYVMKRSLVVRPIPLAKPETTKVFVTAWGRTIPVTVTREASVVQAWISNQDGDVFGLDVEWRPNRLRGENNKVALLQLCNEKECLIVQMLYLDSKPPALSTLLSDPSKGLAGVGVLGDCKRLLDDHGLKCEGEIELTSLAVQRLKRPELKHVGLKVLVHEVLGVKMEKSKRITLSNWARKKLDFPQLQYACIDAWASFALCQELQHIS